jgi:hypothetical protein
MPLPLLMGDRRLDRKQHLVIPGGCVQPLGGADEAGVGLFERFPNFGGGAAVLAAEPILPRDDDPGSSPASQASTASPKARSRHGFEPDTFCSTTSAASSTPAVAAQARMSRRCSSIEIVCSRARLCRRYGTSGRPLPSIAPPV